MSYHGYIPFIQQYTDYFEEPSVLEIGVEYGQSLIPITHHLIKSGKKFVVTGVDIKLRDEVQIILRHMTRESGQTLQLVEDNSLNFLKDCNKKYQIILIDGDHNYFTVKNELSFIKKLCCSDTIIIIDDYSGSWSEKDLFYSTRQEYSNNQLATKEIKLEKAGVKAAVDEFLKENNEWKSTTFVDGEPILLYLEETHYKKLM